MSITIMRGSTPTIRMRPLTNDILVSDLGTPAVAITQDMVYLNPDVTVDSVNNYISFKLTEDETMSLVPGMATYIQQIWKNETNGDVVRFPIHELIVEDTLLSIFDEEGVEPPEDTSEYLDLTIQVPAVEDEDDSEEPERPIIWDEEEEDSEVEIDEMAGAEQILEEDVTEEL